MSDLLKDVIADAKAVKAVAYANAKAALEEAFMPKMQRMVAARLAEEGDEEFEDEDPVAEVPGEDLGNAPAAPAPEAPAEDDINLDMEPEAEPAPEAPAEDEEDLELEALLRELEGEEEMEDDMFEGEEEDYTTDDPANIGSDLSEEVDDDGLEMELEALIREMEGEDDDVPAEEEDVMESRQTPGAKLRKAQKQLSDALKANAILKSTLSEVNLLNAKLMYATKVNNLGTLTPKTQLKMLEAFDRAASVREVKLVYTTLVETLKKPKTTTRRSVNEGSSRPQKAIIPAKNQLSFAPRWAELAGLSKNSKKY